MKTGLASVRDDSGPVSWLQAVHRFENEWRTGVADITRHLAELPGGASINALAAMVKAEIRARFARGESVTVADYLERFPALVEDKERVVSLVYEEYCLREERGERPDTAIFCERYSPWKDSLESQLRYHRVLSQVAGPAFTPPRFPEPGERFAEFQIRSEIGRGGAARVYLAEQTDMGNRPVALKISADRGSEPMILGRLKHAHIVTVLTSARPSDSKLLGLCMQFMPGLPLDKVIEAVRPASRPSKARAIRDALLNLPPVSTEAHAPAGDVDRPKGRAAKPTSGWAGFPENGSYVDGVAWVVKTLAEALAYAHQERVLHLDVKPANVLLTAEGGPQLLDFNLALDPHNAEEADAALRGGTLPYMAPEQLQAFLNPALWKRISETADIYSLGLLASEMLTGRQPEAHNPSLPRARAIGDLLDHRRDLRLDLRHDNKHIPHALEAILNRCVAFDPGDRYASAGNLAEDLGLYLRRRPLKHVQNPSTTERVSFFLKRNALPLAAASLLSVGVIVSAAYVLRELALASAIDAYHKKDTLESRRAFDRMGGLCGRPLVRFYSTSILAKDGHAGEVLEPISSLLGSKADVEILVEWGKGHADFSGEVTDLATELQTASADTRRTALERDALLRQAEALAEFSQRIDPKREFTRLMLANMKEGRGDFEGAVKILDELIEGFETSHSSAPVIDRRKSYSFRYSRARNLASLARKLASSPEAGKLDKAEASALRSLDELEILAKRFFPLKSDALFNVNYIRIEDTLVRSAVAVRRSQPERAREFKEECRKILKKIAPEASGKDFFEELRKRIESSVSDEQASNSPWPAPSSPAG